MNSEPVHFKGQESIKHTAFYNYQPSGGLDSGGLTGVMILKVETTPWQDRLERSLGLEGTFVRRFAAL